MPIPERDGPDGSQHDRLPNTGIGRLLVFLLLFIITIGIAGSQGRLLLQFRHQVPSAFLGVDPGGDVGDVPHLDDGIAGVVLDDDAVVPPVPNGRGRRRCRLLLVLLRVGGCVVVAPARAGEMQPRPEEGRCRGPGRSTAHQLGDGPAGVTATIHFAAGCGWVGQHVGAQREGWVDAQQTRPGAARRPITRSGGGSSSGSGRTPGDGTPALGAATRDTTGTIGRRRGGRGGGGGGRSVQRRPLWCRTERGGRRGGEDVARSSSVDGARAGIVAGGGRGD